MDYYLKYLKYKKKYLDLQNKISQNGGWTIDPVLGQTHQFASWIVLILHKSGKYTSDTIEKNISYLKRNLSSPDKDDKEKETYVNEKISELILNLKDSKYYMDLWDSIAVSDIKTTELYYDSDLKKLDDKYSFVKDNFDKNQELQKLYFFIKGSMVPDAQKQYTDSENKWKPTNGPGDLTNLLNKYDSELSLIKLYQDCVNSKELPDIEKPGDCEEIENKAFLENHEGKRAFIHSMSFHRKEPSDQYILTKCQQDRYCTSNLKLLNKDVIIKISRRTKDILRYNKKTEDNEKRVLDLVNSELNDDSKLTYDEVITIINFYKEWVELEGTKVEPAETISLIKQSVIERLLDAKTLYDQNRVEYNSALATICHTIQDSFSGSHTDRNVLTTEIIDFFDYGDKTKKPAEWGPDGIGHQESNQLMYVLGSSSDLENLYYQNFAKQSNILNLRSFATVQKKLDNYYIKSAFLIAIFYSLYLVTLFEENKSETYEQFESIINDNNKNIIIGTEGPFVLERIFVPTAPVKGDEPKMPDPIYPEAPVPVSGDIPIQNVYGGGKRYLKQEIEKDPLVLTPSGKPSKINKFLLQPEINYIKNKCSKNKEFSKLCKDDNITDILTYFFTSEQTGYEPKKDLDMIAKNTKLSKEFILSVLKHHQVWKSDYFLKL